MRLQFDTLKYAKLLSKKGIDLAYAQQLMSVLTQIEFFNVYSKQEVNSMLSESIEKVFRRQDKKLAVQRREINAQLKENIELFKMQRRDSDRYYEQQLRKHEQQLRDNQNQIAEARRKLINTVITFGLSLATYLSALIFFSH